MDASSRPRTPLFLAGLLVGAAAATAVGFALRPAPRDEAAAAAAPAPQQRPALPASVACPASPIVAAAGAADGQATFDGSSSAGRSIVSGKEAAAGGRDRDAEAAFLAACKVSVAAGDEKGALLHADAMYNLGRHYASLAEEGATNARDLLQRASLLLQHSLAMYQSHLGQSDEKVKFALQAIAAIRERAPATAAPAERVAAVSRPAQEDAVKPAPAKPRAAPAPAVVQAPPLAAPRASPSPPAQPPAKPPQVVAKAPAAIPVAPPAPAPVRAATPPPATVPEPRPPRFEGTRARPSFDCSKARSTPERLICSDDELARQDSELSRIYARAKREADDPAAFQRVSDREWRRRETECRTRECVLDWYAQRRRQLLRQE